MKSLGNRFLPSLFIVAAVIWMVPWWGSAMRDDVDSSWCAVMEYAFRHRFQFGRDLVFTFGPFGFVYGAPFHEETFWIVLAFWISVAGVVAGALGLLWQGRSIYVSLVSALGLLAAAADSRDAVMLSAPLLIVFVYVSSCRPDASRAPEKLVIFLLILVAAISGLVKFNVFVFSACLLLLLDAWRVWNERRLPIFFGIWLLATIVFFLTAGQELRNFPAYVRGSQEIASGYNLAMQLPGDSWQVVGFIVVAGGLLIAFFVSEILLPSRLDSWEEPGWRLQAISTRRKRYLLLVGMATYLFFIFKLGYVRHDLHSVTAAGGLLLASCIFLTRARPPLGRMMAHWLTCGAAWYFFLFHSGFSFGELVERLGARPLAQLDGFRQVFGRPWLSAHARRQADGVAQVKQAHPLPGTRGTVDVFPWDQSVLLAYGLAYRPRPVFQSYSAYTPYLSELNRRFFESARAPDTILFSVRETDDRFPAFMDAASWPSIWRWYDPTGASLDFVALSRRSSPRSVHIGHSVFSGELGYDEELGIEGNGFLWAEIETERSVWGTLRSVVYKPPLIDMVLTVSSEQHSYRLVPGITESGFVLFPVISSATEFALATVAPQCLESHAPLKIRFTSQGGDHAAYPRFHVRIRELHVAGGAQQRPSDGVTALQQLGCGMRQVTILSHGGIPPEPRGTAVFAHAPAKLKLRRYRERSLLLRFGIYDGAWTSGATDGVLFKVSLIASANRTLPIWERRLTPKTVPADRGEQNAALALADLPPGDLILETEPGATPNWDWSYWSRIVFEP